MSLVQAERLVGVHPDLARATRLAAGRLAWPVLVIEGVRSDARQAELWAQGRTRSGDIVTWVKVSKHQLQIDGFGHAVDLAPITGAAIDWKDLARFDALAKAMQAAAGELGVALRWGADWNRNGRPRERGETDSPHFELST